MYLLNHFYYFIAINIIFNNDNIIKFCLRYSTTSKSINVLLTNAIIITAQTVNNSLFEIFVNRTVLQSKFQHFVNLNTDHQKSTTSILLRSTNYETVNNLQSASKQKLKHHISFNSLVDHIRIEFDVFVVSIINFYLIWTIKWILFTSSLLNHLKFDFFRLCFSFESFISSIFIIDLSIHDNVIKSSWFQSIQLI